MVHCCGRAEQIVFDPFGSWRHLVRLIRYATCWSGRTLRSGDQNPNSQCPCSLLIRFLVRHNSNLDLSKDPRPGRGNWGGSAPVSRSPDTRRFDEDRGFSRSFRESYGSRSKLPALRGLGGFCERLPTHERRGRKHFLKRTKSFFDSKRHERASNGPDASRIRGVRRLGRTCRKANSGLWREQSTEVLLQNAGNPSGSELFQVQAQSRLLPPSSAQRS